MIKEISNIKYEDFIPIIGKIEILMKETKIELEKKNKNWQILISNLMLRLFELFNSFQILISNNKVIDSSIIYRSLFNLEIIILYLLISPKERVDEYIGYSNILLSQLQRKIKEQKSFFFMILDEQYNIDTKLGDQFNRKKKKFKQKSIKQMAEEVNRIADYEFMYWILSNIEHSNISSIAEFRGVPGLEFVSNSQSFQYTLKYLIMNGSILSVLKTIERCSEVMHFSEIINIQSYWNEVTKLWTKFFGIKILLEKDNSTPGRMRLYDKNLNVIQEYNRK